MSIPKARQTLTEQLEEAVGLLKRMLRTHGGDISIAYDEETGKVEARLTGMCSACPLKPLTAAASVVPILEQVEGVTTINVAGARVSEAARQRIEAATRHQRESLIALTRKDMKFHDR